MVPYAQRVGDSSQGRVHRTDAWEKAGIDHVQVIQLVRLAVDIQGRRLRILAETAGSGLVRYPGHRDIVLHVGIARDQVVRMHTHVIEHGLEFVVQLLLGYVVLGV